MTLKQKYKEYKEKVYKAEKERNFLRSSESWIEIRQLKKMKLALKDAITLRK
tara:strand:- start:1672 stop:1827 length:156 start_codon:yes stop_codon:yes gene_type:complete